MGTDIFPLKFLYCFEKKRKNSNWDSMFHLITKKQVNITISEVGFDANKIYISNIDYILAV